VEFPDSKSRDQVEKEALEKASINALEKAFGVVLIKGNSTYMKNMNTGKETQTSVVFNSIANTYVKGEVLEVIRPNYEVAEGFTTINGKKVTVRELLCKARFKVKEITDDVPEFEAFTMQCTDPGCRTTSFKDKGSLFLWFKSPDEGYLAVWLDNGKTSQCLFPYSRMPDNFDNGVLMKANKEYVLFSRQPSFTYFDPPGTADEYEMAADGDMEQNRLFVVFAKTPITSPAPQQANEKEQLSNADRALHYRLPEELPSEDFQKWIIRNRTHKPDLRVMHIDISIQK
jgi:hypothetical protein